MVLVLEYFPKISFSNSSCVSFFKCADENIPFCISPINHVTISAQLENIAECMAHRNFALSYWIILAFWCRVNFGSSFLILQNLQKQEKAIVEMMAGSTSDLLCMGTYCQNLA